MLVHPHKPRRHAAALLVPLATLAAGVLAGCGSSHTTGTAADPAGAIPASAPLYAGATVRPNGALKAGALAAGHTLTLQADPYLRLLAALQTPGSPALDFSRDVAPWLGPRAGVFLSSLDASSQLLSLLEQGLLGGSSTASSWPFGAKGAQGAIVLDTSDVAKARSFLTSEANHAGAHAASYRGVAYQATSGGVAFGVVDRFAVIGSESGLRSVIDTTLGGPSLAQAAGYTKLLAAAPAGALAHIYTNPGTSSGAGGASSSGGAPGSGSSSQGSTGLLQLLAGTREANVSLVPTATSIALDADALSSGSAAQTGGLLFSGSEGARALGELPGESWLAVGLGDVGATLAGDVQGLSSLATLSGSTSAGASENPSLGILNFKGLLKGILTPLNVLSANSVEAKRDFQSWMGSAGLFASGTGLVELKGGIVITSKNPARSRAAVAKLAALLRKAGDTAQSISIPGTEAAVAARVTDLPVELAIADGPAANGQTKFVIGLGEASVADALRPSSTLSSAASYSAATSALGEGAQPSLTVDFPSLLGLLEGVGLSADPTISKFVPYLRTLTTLAGGGHSLGGGIERLRLVVGLQQTG
jgi:hypothetical protein